MSSLPTRTDRAASEPPPGRKQIPVAALIGPSHLPNEMRSKSIASDGYMSHWTAANKTTKKRYPFCLLPSPADSVRLAASLFSLTRQKEEQAATLAGRESKNSGPISTCLVAAFVRPRAPTRGDRNKRSR